MELEHTCIWRQASHTSIVIMTTGGMDDPIRIGTIIDSWFSSIAEHIVQNYLTSALAKEGIQEVHSSCMEIDVICHLCPR